MLSQNEPKVLIVDDESGIRDLMTEILEEEGYSVVTAATATEADVIWRNSMLGMVLLDIWMPDMDGVTLLRRWSSENETLNAPVVMMSGHATLETAVEATRLGAVEVLEKPITIASLLQVVQRSMSSKFMRQVDPKLRDLKLGNSKAMQKLKASFLKCTDTQPIFLTGHAEDEIGFFSKLLVRQGMPVYILENLRQLEGEVNKIVTSVEGGSILVQYCDLMTDKQQHGLIALIEQALKLEMRVIIESAKSLAQLREKNFSAALLEHLAHQCVTIPDIQQYAEDLPEICTLALKQIALLYNMQMRSISSEALNELRNYDFLEGLSQFYTILKFAVLDSEGQVLQTPAIVRACERYSHISGSGLVKKERKIETPVETSIYTLPLREARTEFERGYCKNLLKITDGNMQKAAQLSGIERTSLYRKLRSLDLDYYDNQGAEE